MRKTTSAIAAVAGALGVGGSAYAAPGHHHSHGHGGAASASRLDGGKDLRARATIDKDLSARFRCAQPSVRPSLIV